MGNWTLPVLFFMFLSNLWHEIINLSIIYYLQRWKSEAWPTRGFENFAQNVGPWGGGDFPADSPLIPNQGPDSRTNVLSLELKSNNKTQSPSNITQQRLNFVSKQLLAENNTILKPEDRCKPMQSPTIKTNFVWGKTLLPVFAYFTLLSALDLRIVLIPILISL